VVFFRGVVNGRVGHHFGGFCRVVQRNGLKEINIYFAPVGNAEKGIGFEEDGVLQAVYAGHSANQFCSFSSSFAGQRPGQLSKICRLETASEGFYFKTSRQFADYGEDCGEDVNMFVRIEVGWFYAVIDEPLNLGGKLGSYYISVFGACD